MIGLSRTHRRGQDDTLPDVPNYGRTVRVVGPVENIETEQLPHPLVRRGEMGKPLYNWYHNSVSDDPLVRCISNVHGLDRRNQFHRMVGALAKGDVNPVAAQADPLALSNHLKAVARVYGADAVGIGRTHPSMFYRGGKFVADATEEDDAMNDAEALAKRFPFVIVTPVSIDHSMIQAHRHLIGDLSYGLADQRIALVRAGVQGVIVELGYNVLAGAVVPQAVALAAGVGELGRNGMLITKEHGARVVIGETIATDMPLVADEPLDIGVDDFCKICRKCAITCPTNSIPFGDKVVWNGVEKYKINWQTCYKLRPYTHEHWGICLTCLTVCPYSKPKTWWHGLATNVLHYTPKHLRPVAVHGLKWLDDRFWGAIPRKRVRFLGYDSGVKPGEKACTIEGCTASHVGGTHAVEPKGNVGYYFPLKENTNRFVKRG